MHPAQVTTIADSINAAGIRITTQQLRYWRGIHAEFMTHRQFSRNAGSSRARPSKGIIEQVRNDPWGPLHWGANEPGMQANSELSPDIIEVAKGEWAYAAHLAAAQAQNLLNLEAHKQIVNRLLEPFTFIDVVVTSTNWNNWDTLRDHKDADPTIQDLARRMKESRDASTPKYISSKCWHLPYITEDDWIEVKKFLYNGMYPDRDTALELLRKISVARCARVSYKAFDGTHSPIEKDIELFDKLLVSQPLHASPAEHQAMPDTLIGDKLWAHPQEHGNLVGWRQYRKMLPNEFVPG